MLGVSLVAKHFLIGDKIIVEGAEGDEFFLIREGLVKVEKEDPESGKLNMLCELAKGEYFGEAALLSKCTRLATITAIQPTTCLTLDRSKFSELFQNKVLKVNFAKRVGVSAEVYEGASAPTSGAPSEQAKQKTDEQRKAILEVMVRNMLFKNLDTAQCEAIVDEMWLKDVQKGVSVIRQGDMGDNYYVIYTGEFEIFLNQPNGQKPKKVATFAQGSSFGELALMYNAPRAATVTASVDSTVWAVDRMTYRRILMQSSRDKIAEYVGFLSKVDAFSALSAEERNRVAEALEECSFPTGHDIVKEGDMGDTFFILKKGAVW